VSAPEQAPPGSPPWLQRIYAMGGRRPGESEAELCERRGREADERFRVFWAGVEARRAAGIPDVPCALLPAFGQSKFDPHNRIQGRPRRGWR
jgi:hypothetical protein